MHETHHERHAVCATGGARPTGLSKNGLFALGLPDLHRPRTPPPPPRSDGGERQDHSLRTLLMNYAYLSCHVRERYWENRKHFFAVAAVAPAPTLLIAMRGSRLRGEDRLSMAWTGLLRGA